MDNRAIAVFDSGLGGLTGLDMLQKLLPGESCIYFGDSGRAPYGDKNPGEIAVMSRQLLDFVLGFDVKAVLVACGTTSSTCLSALQAASPVPVVGVIEPAAEAAAAATKNGRVGVIATRATIESGTYPRALRSIRPGTEVFDRACPNLVPMIEAGRFAPDDDFVADTARACVDDLLAWGMDTLLLGCTHYYLLAPVLQKLCGEGVAIVENGGTAARKFAGILEERGLLARGNGAGAERYFTSGDRALFAAGAGMFLGRDILEKTIRVEPFDL